MAGSLQPVLGLLTQALTPTKAVGAGEGEGGVTPSVGLVSDLSGTGGWFPKYFLFHCSVIPCK